MLTRVQRAARVLPVLTACSQAGERQRLTRALERGERLRLAERRPRQVTILPALRALDHARELARDGAAEALYVARIDELEAQLSLLASLGEPRAVRPIVARLYGRGDIEVPLGDTFRPVRELAQRLLDDVDDEAEAHTLPAETRGEGASAAAFMRLAAQHAKLTIEVKVSRQLVSDAAAGERTVYLADRHFGQRQVARLAVHEVLGHLLASANGRAQPLGLLALGTAGSFADQEGIAIYLEEDAGVLDGHRVRTLAARVLATDSMHSGASFEETARMLRHDYGFSSAASVAMSMRAHRAGGVARDVVYLAGWLRVRHAIERGEATTTELRNGKVSLADLPALRALSAEDLWRRPVFRSQPGYCPSLGEGEWPNRSSRRLATTAGTNFETSPPNRRASLTRFDAT